MLCQPEKGESGRDHVQSYNKHFKANAEDFYNIPISCGINPMVVFAIGVHESGYGTSDIANDKNNFWGINAVDGDAYNKAYTYDTIQEGIKAEAELLKKICNRRRMAEYYNKRPRQRSNNIRWCGNIICIRWFMESKG